MNVLAGCTGKSSFPSWAKANRIATRMNRRDSHEGHVSAYRCKRCGEWHIGRNDKQDRAASKQDRRTFFEEMR